MYHTKNYKIQKRGLYAKYVDTGVGYMATARKKGNGYEIRVYCGLDSNYKRIDKSKMWIPDSSMTAKQIEKELDRQKILFEEEVKSGRSYNCNMRFNEFSKMWLKEYGEKQLAPKTYSRYIGLLDRINQAIGHMKLKDIKPLHLNRFYDNLSEKGISKKIKYDENGNIINDRYLAPKTIFAHHQLLSKMLSTAVKWQLIEINVAERADPPKVPHKDIRFLDETEIKNLIMLLDNEPIQYKTMIILLIYTGIRRGELCGLEWKDIDFAERRMKIVRSSQYIGNCKLITKEPKTKSGVREISLSHTACQLLTEYRRWQRKNILKMGDAWNDTDRLFTQWNGLPIYPDTITDWFAKFIKRNEFPHVTLHSLCHTNASLMIAEGADVCTVSKRLGHANTATTLNIYAHALKSKDSEIADKLENILTVV